LLEALEDRTVPTVLFTPFFGAETTTNYGIELNDSPGTNIYMIYWGSYWSTAAGSSMATSIQNSVNNIFWFGPYLDGLHQYGVPYRAYQPAIPVNHVFNYTDPSNLFTTAALQNVVLDAIYNKGLPEADYYANRSIYFVVTPPTIQSDTPNAAGWHNNFIDNHDPSEPEQTIYGWIGGWSDYSLDIRTQILSHETAQAMSDPYIPLGIQVTPGSGWTQDGGHEICDYEATNHTYRLGGYVVNSYWSTANSAYMVSDGNSQTVTVDYSTLVVNGDQRPNHNDTVALDTWTNGSAQQGVLVTLNGEVFQFDPGVINQVVVNTGDGTDTVNVLRTIVPVTINNGGGFHGDRVNVGNSGTVQGIQASVTVTNPVNFTTVSVDDSADGSQRSASVDLTTIGGYAYERVAGLSTAPIQTKVMDTDSITVHTGFGGATVNVWATGVPTTLTSHGANTGVLVGSGGSVQNITGALTINNPPNYTSVIVDDSTDTAARTTTVDLTTINGSTYERVTGLAPAAIQSKWGDTNSLLLHTGTAGGTANVWSTRFLTGLTAHGANTTVNVGNAGSLQDIQGTLAIDGLNSTTINLADSADSSFRAVTIGAGGVTGLAQAAINFDALSVKTLALAGGSGNNVYTVTGAPASTSLTLTAGAGSNTLVGPNANTLWTISASNAGRLTASGLATSINFTGIRNLTGGSAADTFFFSDGAAVTGTVNGGGGSNELDALYSTPVTVNLQTSTVTGVGGSVLSIQNFFGGSATNTLIGPNAPTIWNITGTNTGNLNGNIHFSAFQNLTGGSAADAFVFSDGAGVTGTVNGGGGTNLLDYAAYTTSVTVNLSTNTATGAGTVQNIQQVRGGSDDDSLTGNATGTTTFLASPGDDTVTGVGGTNTLVGPNLDSTWNIIGSNAGTLTFDVNTTTLTGVQNLQGGSAADTFVFSNGAAVSGINGGGGGDTLDYSSYTGNVMVNLPGGTATGVGGMANLQNFLGGRATNTLLGLNTATTWNITANNTGTLTGGISFSGFQNLTGGAGPDTFALADGARVDGTLNGGGGVNTLDESAYLAPVTVNLSTSTATGLGLPFANIQSFLGGTGTNILIGQNVATTWNITSANTGTLTGGMSFTGFQNLTGGSAADTFAFSDGAGIDGNLDGGGGSNTLNEAAYTTPVTVDLQARTATGVGGTFANIQSFIGGGAAGNMLVGPNATTTWNIANNAGTLTGGISFSAFPNLTGGAGDNTFVLSAGATLGGTLTAAGGGTQTLQAGAGSTLASLNHTGTGTLRLATGVTVTGSFSNSAGTFDARNHTLNIGGNWTWNAGSFLSTGGSVRFNGSVDQTLDSGGQAFANLVHQATNSTRTLRLTGNDLTVSGTLSNLMGAFDANTQAVTVQGLTTVDNTTSYLGSTGSQQFGGGLALLYGSSMAGDSLIVGGNVTASPGTSATPASITGNLSLGSSNRVFTVEPVTIFASGLGTPDGLALDSSGSLYVANYSSGTVTKVDGGGAVTTFASGFTHPEGLAFDSSGNLYVSHGDNAGKVSKVTPGGVVTLFADYPTGLYYPKGLAFDSSGNLFAADYAVGTLTRLTPSGASSNFDYGFGIDNTFGLAFDGAGNLYVANSYNGTVSKVTPGGVASTFAGGFSHPQGLAFDGSGNLYVANTGNNTVSKVTPAGTVTTFLSTGLNQPEGLAFGSSGNLYISNAGNNTVVKVPSVIPLVHLQIDAVISGAAGVGLTKAGTGTMRLTGDNTYTGPTIMSAGKLVIDGSQPSSDVTVSAGTLLGVGTVGNITVNGGTFLPGGLSSTGIFNSAGDVTLAAASTFSGRLNGTTAGTGYDQLSVSGAVNLNNATLNVTLGFTPAIGTSFTILTTTDGVTGTFQGLPEGGTIVIAGETFQITYAGNGGTDVVLTRVA
jgi:autotransporter-associated beta strand protein